MVKHFLICLVTLSNLFFSCLNAEKILHENLLKAEQGDFIVISQNKAYTLLTVQQKENSVLTLEEVTIPNNRISPSFTDWRSWFESGAHGATCWVRYRLNINTHQITYGYSFLQKNWITLSQADNVLLKLIHLNFSKIPNGERKKAGAPPPPGLPDKRPIWQPRLIVNGSQIKGAHFTGWRTYWPQDASDLSGKVIEVYLPENEGLAPTYFPYWLEVQGMLGSVKIRIIDSGKGIQSPQLPFN